MALRRIEMTLSRWGEKECGDSNDRMSWAIERDEKTNKPYMMTYFHDGAIKPRRTPIADRETGALKRMAKIIAARNARCGDTVQAYHQTDPRGCSLYILRAQDISNGSKAENCYTNGLAVCD